MSPLSDDRQRTAAFFTGEITRTTGNQGRSPAKDDAPTPPPGRRIMQKPDGPNYREQVVAWIHEQMINRTEVDLPEFAKEATAHFAKDRKFVAGLFGELAPQIIYDLCRRSISVNRWMLQPDIDGEPSPSPGVRPSRFEKWFEHVAEGRSVRLMDMTRSDLLAAAIERRKRGEHEIGLARLWTRLAGTLDEGERVRDQFTAEQIAAMAATEEVPMATA